MCAGVLVDGLIVVKSSTSSTHKSIYARVCVCLCVGTTLKSSSQHIHSGGVLVRFLCVRLCVPRRLECDVSHHVKKTRLSQVFFF